MLYITKTPTDNIGKNWTYCIVKFFFLQENYIFPTTSNKKKNEFSKFEMICIFNAISYKEKSRVTEINCKKILF